MDQLRTIATAAVVKVGRAPPNISSTFLAKPGQSVLQPEYIRVERKCDPSITAMENPDRLRRSPSRRRRVPGLPIRRATDQHELARDTRFAAAVSTAVHNGPGEIRADRDRKE